jgi:hypothetical protein
VRPPLADDGVDALIDLLGMPDAAASDNPYLTLPAGEG